MIFQCKYSENVYDAGLQFAERRQGDEQVGQEANVNTGESGVYLFFSASGFQHQLSNSAGVWQHYLDKPRTELQYSMTLEAIVALKY